MFSRSNQDGSSRGRRARVAHLRLRRVCLDASVITLVYLTGCSVITQGEMPECMEDSDCAGFSAGPAICSVDLVCVPSAQTSDPPQDQVPDSPGDNPPPDDEGAPIGGTGGTGGLVGTGGTGGAAPTGGTGGAVETGGTGGVANASGGSGNGGTVPLGPATVAWTNTETRPTLGDSTGGTAFLAKCEDDEVLVGLKVAAGAWTDQVTGICQPTFVNEDSTNQPSEYVLTLGQRRNLMSYPATTTSQVHDLTCAEGSAVVGMRISQQNSGDPAAVVIPRVWLTCAELYLSNPTGSGEIRWRNPFEIGPISGSYANDTAWFASDSLPEGTLTVGVHGASGSWVDRVGLVAAPVAVTTGQ